MITTARSNKRYVNQYHQVIKKKSNFRCQYMDTNNEHFVQTLQPYMGQLMQWAPPVM